MHTLKLSKFTPVSFSGSIFEGEGEASGKVKGAIYNIFSH